MDDEFVDLGDVERAQLRMLRDEDKLREIFDRADKRPLTIREQDDQANWEQIMAERMAAFDATPAGKELAAEIERQAALYGKSESQPAIQPEFPNRAAGANDERIK